MRLFATIAEATPEAALDAIRRLPADHDGVELRLDSLRSPLPLAALRAATGKPLLLTNRGGATPDIEAAIAAGIDLVDVEHGNQDERVPRYRDRIVLSHHDYERVPDLDALLAAMRAHGCAHVKVAVTPRNYGENVQLLERIAPGETMIGMGERGLYARLLAPFFGSDLFFAGNAAPGQIGLEQALAIYGKRPLPADPRIFAILGNPSGHSRSPAVHNPRFRAEGLNAAYTIASFQTFAEIAEPFARAERFAPAGLSVTAPFKEEAFAFARRIGADIRENAREAESVNTLVRTARGFVADNTDVDGFETIVRGKRAALIGAGGTARAALVALRRKGIGTTVYNRTVGRLGAKPLGELRHFDGDLVVNTLPVAIDLPLRDGVNIVDTVYTGGRGGVALFEAQAVRQFELFREAF
ncbi:MAG TPA: type I 3-dehydroquinate dehydratase [Thermoanaerobaculia bacterium]|jgi:3-dehydroquinate dehydratase type I|nr:type I 3-dehydroquinate dehydratase [Thermoanaerobaculia bacterium]